MVAHDAKAKPNEDAACLPTVGDSWDKAVKFKINNEQTHRAVSMVLFASIAIPKGVVFFPVPAKSVHPSVCDVWD